MTRDYYLILFSDLPLSAFAVLLFSRKYRLATLETRVRITIFAKNPVLLTWLILTFHHSPYCKQQTHQFSGQNIFLKFPREHGVNFPVTFGCNGSALVQAICAEIHCLGLCKTIDALRATIGHVVGSFYRLLSASAVLFPSSSFSHKTNQQQTTLQVAKEAVKQQKELV